MEVNCYSAGTECLEKCLTVHLSKMDYPDIYFLLSPHIQSTLVILNSLISNNRLSLSENLVLV